jgi:hypothetical protein
LRTKIFFGLLLAYAGACVWFVATHDDQQWDFHSYHLSAQAYAKGINPYDTAAVAKASGDPGFVYPYPPLTLKLFALLNGFETAAAARLFLLLKCVMLAALLLIWQNLFFDGQTDLVFWLLCLVGFNATIFLDIRAGNVSLFEQVGLWLAFYSYTRRNLFLFSALIVLVASFKLMPLFFLGLLIFAEGRKKYAYLAGAVTAFGGIGWLNHAANPVYVRSFIDTILGFSSECGGIINPSLGCFIADVNTNGGGFLDHRLFGHISLQWVVYAAVAVTILFAGLPPAHPPLLLHNPPDRPKKRRPRRILVFLWPLELKNIRRPARHLEHHDRDIIARPRCGLRVLLELFPALVRLLHMVALYLGIR